jgi:excisionase family DNA binding protein
MTTIERLLTTEEVAEMLRVSRRTLETWRSTARGPVFVRVGRRIGYRPEAVEQWLAERTSTA